MINMSKDVMWIFSLENPMVLPSYIVSGIFPADYNKIQKVIFLKNHSPKNFLNEKKPKIIIVGKAFHLGVVELVKEAKRLKIKVISIFDDWHFDTKDKNTFKFNLEIASNSDKIIAKTEKAIDIIFKNTNIKGEIIPDCIRYKTLKTINFFSNPYNLCWFGFHTNHKSLIKGINEISLNTRNIKIKIITNQISNLKKKLKNIHQKLSLEFVEWTLSMDENINNSEIIIIPLINDKKSIVKSSNRIIDSLNMGRFVIINENNQFSEFRNFCYFGNINDGLNWLDNNQKLAISMIKKGQQYVLKKYNYKTVGDKWKTLIEKF